MIAWPKYRTSINTALRVAEHDETVDSCIRSGLRRKRGTTEILEQTIVALVGEKEMLTDRLERLVAAVKKIEEPKKS